MKQKGFTLVELIVVIVILGILAATAIPRFVSMTGEARVAAMNGMAGAMRSAVALAQSRYVVQGDATLTAVTMGVGTATQNVTVAAGTGIPTAANAGIVAALQTTDGFNVVCDGTTCTVTQVGGPAACSITYTGATGAVAAGAVTAANCG